MQPTDASIEPHLTVVEIAAAWKIHRSTVERIFFDEPGVLKIGRPEGFRKRRYVTLRIPQSVVARVHDRMDVIRTKGE